VPILGIVTSLYLVFTLPRLTKEVVFGWLLIGLVVYFTYSIRHSKVQAMQRTEDASAGPAVK
jgi:APA family basic amino acid/polyamine antiporter